MAFSYQALGQCLGVSDRNVCFGSQDRVKGIAFDSRQVKPGMVFFALPGEKTDGHLFINSAIQAGASLVFAQEGHPIPPIHKNTVPVIAVPDIRAALALTADLFYNSPSLEVPLIGVTGTNGKTTTTHLIAQLLAEGLTSLVGLSGTLGGKIFGPQYTVVNLDQGSGRTTPEAPELQAVLAQLIDDGCRQLTIEVSSHALQQKRVFGCHFTTTVFTNLTQDHLDYHLNMENYFEAKGLLFEMQAAEIALAGRTAILNADDPYHKRYLSKIGGGVEVIRYGLRCDRAELFASQFQSLPEGGIQAQIKSPWGDGTLHTPLAGQFNLYNALAAIAVGVTHGVRFADCLEIMRSIKPADGRFQLIPKPVHDLPTCIVDYAHTPDSLENVLQTARQLVEEGGRLICVFGCGGDRDNTKRALMGEIATRMADFCYITSDNPRSEDPNQIIADILAGIPGLRLTEVEPDRAKAIQRVILEAKPQDVILIAGKGHETYQIIGQRTYHFDDREEIHKAYKARTGPKKGNQDV